MMLTMKSMFGAAVVVAVVAAVVAVAAQAPIRPGEMTQARVWVQNRPDEPVPVVVERTAETSRVNLVAIDPYVTLPTRAAVQRWSYMSIAIASNAVPEAALQRAGNEGWEAVGILQSGPTGLTVLLKRPQ